MKMEVERRLPQEFPCMQLNDNGSVSWNLQTWLEESLSRSNGHVVNVNTRNLQLTMYSRCHSSSYKDKLTKMASMRHVVDGDEEDAPCSSTTIVKAQNAGFSGSAVMSTVQCGEANTKQLIISEVLSEHLHQTVVCRMMKLIQPYLPPITTLYTYIIPHDVHLRFFPYLLDGRMTMLWAQRLSFPRIMEMCDQEPPNNDCENHVLCQANRMQLGTPCKSCRALLSELRNANKDDTAMDNLLQEINSENCRELLMKLEFLLCQKNVKQLYSLRKESCPAMRAQFYIFDASLGKLSIVHDFPCDVIISSAVIASLSERKNFLAQLVKVISVKRYPWYDVAFRHSQLLNPWVEPAFAEVIPPTMPSLESFISVQNLIECDIGYVSPSDVAVIDAMTALQSPCQETRLAAIYFLEAWQSKLRVREKKLKVDYREILRKNLFVIKCDSTSIGKRASGLWKKFGFKIERQLIQSLLLDVIHPEWTIRDMTCRALLPLLNMFPSEGPATFHQLIHIYRELVKRSPPSFDVRDSPDNTWELRCSVAFALKECASCLSSAVLSVFGFIVEGLSDHHLSVQLYMFNAVKAVIRFHGKKSAKDILAVFEDRLKNIYDRCVRDTIAVLMGRTAENLKKNDPRLRSISLRLKEAKTCPVDYVKLEAVVSYVNFHETFPGLVESQDEGDKGHKKKNQLKVKSKMYRGFGLEFSC